MATDFLGSGGGESAANPGEWLTVSAWVCDSGSVHVWQRQCGCVTASVWV